MDAYGNQPHCEAGSMSVGAKYDRLAALVRQLPGERQSLLVNELVELVGLTEELKDAIDRSGLSHYRLAQETGVTPGAISRFVAGERDLRLETAAKLADALGLELKPKKKPRKTKKADG